LANILEFSNVDASYGGELILREVYFSLERGEATIIRGRSGAGKTTLLKIAALLKKPLRGAVILDGVDVWHQESIIFEELRKNIAYVPQIPDLIEDLTVLENITLPLMLRGWDFEEAKSKAKEMMKSLGLGNIEDGRKAGKLSGGQKQRALIARALVIEPKLLVADEPTSFLDEETSKDVFEIIEREREEREMSVIASTTELVKFNKSNWTEYMLEWGKLKRI
jgi:ABC-type lipoprotein export system ATPase subunit